MGGWWWVTLCENGADRGHAAVCSHRLTECQTYTHPPYNHFDRISASNFVCQGARMARHLPIGNTTPEKQSFVDTGGDRPPGGQVCVGERERERETQRGGRGPEWDRRGGKNMGDDRPRGPAKHSPAGLQTHGEQSPPASTPRPTTPAAQWAAWSYGGPSHKGCLTSGAGIGLTTLAATPCLGESVA